MSIIQSTTYHNQNNYVSRQNSINPKFLDVYYAELQENGSIQGGIRPVIIVQNNVGNKYSPTTTVIPLTSNLKKTDQPTHVILTTDDVIGLPKDSMALVEQMQPINRYQLKGRVGKIDSDKSVSRLKNAMCVQLSLC